MSLLYSLSIGICNTDIELCKGYYPFIGILGHEFVVKVIQGPPELINKRVVGDINATCGHCICCMNHNQHHCTNRTVLGIVCRNGAFAE